jgi:hypothetical protein
VGGGGGSRWGLAGGPLALEKQGRTTSRLSNIRTRMSHVSANRTLPRNSCASSHEKTPTPPVLSPGHHFM